MDICMICEDEHEGHDITHHRKVLIKDNDFINTMKDLNNVIDDFKYKINIIKDILNKI